MADKSRHSVALVTVSAMAGIAIVAVALYIMVHGIGLQDNLNFGAGAYYYADIPDFDRYLKWEAYKTNIPYWVYALLFIFWGVLMYLLWKWIDKRK